MSERWRRWVPDAVAASIVGFAGLFEISTSADVDSSTPALFLVVVGIAAAVGLSRHAPGLALALVWVVCAMQALTVTPFLVVEIAIGVVAFGTARWGTVATVWLSGLSIPASALCVVAFVATGSYLDLIDNGSNRQLLDTAQRFGNTWQVGTLVLGLAVLAVPWLAGLSLRFSDRARRSQVSQVAAEEEAARAVRESEQAREIARLREEQARLARDVHDVVGHSLAVILAQAESAQYLPDVDTQRLKVTMENIATSARSSLQDVRQVLTPVSANESPRSGGLDDLVAGVRSSGHEVVASEVGTPQPLPPELDTVAFRVLQEMLTNAIKHGQRGEPVFVERHWPDGSWVGELRIEVRNVVASASASASADLSGQGLEGMRRRLDAVGGRLDVRRRESSGGQTFTVTAWVPVRTVTR